MYCFHSQSFKIVEILILLFFSTYKLSSTRWFCLFIPSTHIFKQNPNRMLLFTCLYGNSINGISRSKIVPVIFYCDYSMKGNFLFLCKVINLKFLCRKDVIISFYFLSQNFNMIEILIFVLLHTCKLDSTRMYFFYSPRNKLNKNPIR